MPRGLEARVFMPAIEASPLLLMLAAIGGYLLGSIPFGILIARLFGLGDLRKIGSGNIGATNVLRTGSKTAAALTLILDAGKGAAALLIARWFIGEDAAQIAGFSAFVGHLFPVWLRFKGGKGVATALGLFLALALPLGVSACAAWLVGALFSKRSSIGALTATLAAPLFSTWVAPYAIAFSIAIGVLVWVRHKDNILRVMNGTEPKIKL